MWVILTCHWCHRKKVREGAPVAGWDTLEPDVYRWGEGHFSLRTQKQKRLRSLEAQSCLGLPERTRSRRGEKQYSSFQHFLFFSTLNIFPISSTAGQNPPQNLYHRFFSPTLCRTSGTVHMAFYRNESFFSFSHQLGWVILPFLKSVKSSDFFCSQILQILRVQHCDSLDRQSLTDDGQSHWRTISGVNVNVTQSCPTLCNPMDYIIHPWNSLGQNAGVGSLSLLQGIFPTRGLNPAFRHLAIEKDLADECLMKQCLWRNRTIK